MNQSKWKRRAIAAVVIGFLPIASLLCGEWLLFFILSLIEAAILFAIYMVYRKITELKARHQSSSYQADKQKENLVKQATVMIPPTINGKVVAYRYNDVHVYTPFDTIYCDDGWQLGVGTPLQIFPEPNNQYDPNAVSLACQNYVIGYLNKGKLQDMANDWIRTNRPVYAVVSSFDKAERKMTIALAFYDMSAFEKQLMRGPTPKEYRLTGNTNEEMQSNIWSCSRGDECTIMYDYEKNRYMVSSGLDIGYLPASAQKIIDEYGEDRCSVFIAGTDTNQNGKDVVSVYIFPA